MWSAFADQKIYLDSNILIYAVEGQHRWKQATEQMLDAIDRSIFLAVTSELALAEVLVKPIEDGDKDLIETYQRFFSPNSAVKTLPVDRAVLLTAAEVQGQTGTKLADAIHVATARQSGCHYFLTEDDRLGRALGRGLEWLGLAQVEKL